MRQRWLTILLLLLLPTAPTWAQGRPPGLGMMITMRLQLSTEQSQQARPLIAAFDRWMHARAEKFHESMRQTLGPPPPRHLSESQLVRMDALEDSWNGDVAAASSRLEQSMAPLLSEAQRHRLHRILAHVPPPPPPPPDDAMPDGRGEPPQPQ